AERLGAYTPSLENARELSLGTLYHAELVTDAFVQERYEMSSGALYDAMLERRKQTQPLGLPSCGSVFRNPPNDHAARLIEAAGLKGFKIGGAEVSEKHANFIINRDAATATDIEELIEHVRHSVIEAHGIELQHEVRIVGELPQ
ncbi:MAG: UDP-N-acetylenolpyruvoylglucosamine reductase, partial [Proteobacteria bacterium]|nr:UDP-N-acetylenolpyruvoylglucosamine reductase [Pseudomonadota bacterium]